MKKINNTVHDRYLSPQCAMMTVEAGGILAASPATLDLSIEDPSWNTDGDYGLE